LDATSKHATNSRGSIRRTIVLIAALLAAGAVTSLAWAQETPPPPEGPAIDQYVETLPSGGGGQAVGVGKARTKPLSHHAAKKLTRTATPLAPKLKSIATSSSYGAPQQTLPRRSPAPARPATAAKPTKKPKPRSVPRVTHSEPPAAPVRSSDAERGTALSAAVSAATAGSDRGPVILLGVIVLLTTAAALVAAARRAGHAR
jgi:hypothetical protein